MSQTQKTILFDLDGTLTDSGEGIMNCAIPVLEHFGLPVPDRQALRVMVGPPLRHSFARFGIREADMDEAVQIYRSRYLATGMFENEPYPGIRELLEALQSRGCRLFVATSKPETMAVTILEKFGLAGYFEKICGALSDKSRDSKELVVAWALEQAGDAGQVIMVGDTRYDVLGAACHHIPTIGVSWGYGPQEEMTAAGAIAIAHTTQELFRLIENM